MDLVVLGLVVVAIVVGVVMIRANWGGAKEAETGDRARNRPRSNPDEPRIENVGPGGVFNLRGFGPNMEDLDVIVLARHLYREGGFEWFELEGESGDRKIWLTVVEDDELEISVVLRKLSLAELGLSKKQLKRFDKKEKGSFAFEGVEYVYDDSGDATFIRNGDQRSMEDFYYWDFDARDGKQSVTVEKWADGTYEVHVSQTIRASQITVYTTAGGE